jgi:hypothetical protein
MNYPDCPDRNSFQSGLEFQDHVCCLLAKDNIILQNTVSKLYQLRMGENLQGFEIKMDRRCTETGRLSIEVAERSSKAVPFWTPSGIYRTDNTWLYLQGNYEVLFVFQVNFLRILHGKGTLEEKQEPTIRAFYLPFEKAEKWAAKVYRCEKPAALESQFSSQPNRAGV